MCGHVAEIRTSFLITRYPLPVVTDLQIVGAFAATANNRDTSCACIDGILDQFCYGLQRIGLGEGDDGYCVPVVTDAQFTAFEGTIWRCWFLLDRKSTRLNSSHVSESRMPS